jgi:Flp pilus assembly pilin Flp
LLRRFAASDAGATSVEYALLLAGVTAVIITAVGVLGTKTKGLFAMAETRWP